MQAYVGAYAWVSIVMVWLPRERMCDLGNLESEEGKEEVLGEAVGE